MELNTKGKKNNQNSTSWKIKKTTMTKHNMNGIISNTLTQKRQKNEGKQTKTKTNCHIINDKTKREHKQLSEPVIL